MLVSHNGNKGLISLLDRVMGPHPTFCSEWTEPLPMCVLASHRHHRGLSRAGPALYPLAFQFPSAGTQIQALSDGNDPSAGSPTETLLRLLLPLNDQVRPSFAAHLATDRDCQPGGRLRASLNHSIGSSDGRCVQRAGT